VTRVWLEDDDPGHARTMAELDKRLRRAERMAMRFDRLSQALGRSDRGGQRWRNSASPDDSDLAEGHPS
jgi:hypothetical protein